MTPEQARQVLAPWRSGIPVGDDRELAAAIELARADRELGDWLARREAFHASLRTAVRNTPVPPDLADRILAASRTRRPRFTPAPLLWATAAAAILLIGMTLRSYWPTPEAPLDDFATFRNRMVRMVVREYRMDLVTNDLGSIRGFLASRQGPADFQLPPGLAQLPALGGGQLSWQGRGVAMVCLNGGPMGTLFLFVVPADSVASGRPESPTPTLVNRLATVAWSANGRTYVLAADAPLDDLRRLLDPQSPG